jgi:hypothetical protein
VILSLIDAVTEFFPASADVTASAMRRCFEERVSDGDFSFCQWLRLVNLDTALDPAGSTAFPSVRYLVMNKTIRVNHLLQVHQDAITATWVALRDATTHEAAVVAFVSMVRRVADVAGDFDAYAREHDGHDLILPILRRIKSRVKFLYRRFVRNPARRLRTLGAIAAVAVMSIYIGRAR